MTSLTLHDLRASLGSSGSYRAAGWHPKLSVSVLGPIPPASELVWAVSRPDGSPWFVHRVPAPVLDARQQSTVELERWGEDDDLDEPGAIAHSLRLVSELDGVDDLLSEGWMTVVALPGEHRYAVDNDRMLGRAWLCLDTVDEPDAPLLRVSTFVGGEVEAWQLEAHLFVEGERFAQASSVESQYTFTANDGSPIGRAIVASFDTVRGWNNLSASGWGGDWHLLDARDGHYEVKLVREARVCRVVSFDMMGGRIVAPGLVEPDPWCGAVIEVGATVVGDRDRDGRGDGADAGVASPSSTGGGLEVDSLTAARAAELSLDDVYALRTAPAAPASVAAPEPTQPGPTAAPAPAVAELDDEVRGAVQTYVDRAERLLLTWETELAAPPPYDFGQVLAAEAVQRERPAYDDLASDIATVPDDHLVALSGDQASLGSLRTRTAALFATADARVASAQQSEHDELAPYRALLTGDKLAVFDEHPAGSFVYTTTDRHIIETPEELAAADFWFFEGPLDLRSSAHVEGVEISASTEGWRVLGWHFAPDGSTLAEFEHQGLGPSAPRSAFRPPA